MELTEKDQKKLERNELENKTFEETLDKLLKNKLPTNELVRIGTTPFCLRIAGAGVMPLMMSASDLRNCIEGQKLSNHNKRNHTENHNIPIETVKKFPEALRNPVCICTGNKPNSLLVISDLMDKHNQNIVFPIQLSANGRKSKINKIESAYGKKNIQNFIQKMYIQNKILAVHKEKIDKCFVTQSNIGRQLPKFEAFTNLDNSIAYSMANVKYISENFQNIFEKEKSSNEETERNDNMAETSQQELLERIAALEKQVQAMSDEQQNLKEQIATVNQFVSAITEAQNFEQSMSTIESMGKQVLDCGKAEFWCYDGAENKYFTNDENRGGRDWQIAKENMRIAADTMVAHIADGEAYIPIISNDKVAGILVASEKDGTFDKASLDKFSPNGQIANTIDLSLKKEFEHQGRITDELTRLKNRQGAKEYAANTMAHNVNDEKDMCLIMCDIDHFKSINDNYGHDAGDTVLKNVAGILQSGTRQGADSAFRWGGEEMVCVLNCDYDHAMDIAERLRQQIESTTHLVYNADKEPTNVSVTISMGVYQVKPDKEITQENAFSFFESQLKFADELAYKAKETGRNKVVGESDIINAEKARETAQEVITAGTIDKYGLEIDFKNINEIVLTTATENYIGGIDNNGHERRDNSELAVNEVKIYYSEYYNGGSLVRLESEDPFDMTITIDEALEEIQNFLDETLDDRDKNIIIKYNDGRKEYIDPNKLLEEKTKAEKAKETGRNKVVGESDIMFDNELNYAKAFSGETCIAYALDKNDMENGIIAVAKTTIYGGTVTDLTNNPNGIEDKVYSDISKGRDSEAMEAAKLDFENSSNTVKKDDLRFSKADNGTYAVWNKNEIFDNAYVLIADGSNEKPLNFYKDVSDEIREYIVSTLGVQEKESYSIFFTESVEERAYFRADNPDINSFLQRLADYYHYPEFTEGCKSISEEEFAALEQSKHNPPAFCAKMSSHYNELSIWDNDKIATVNLDEAFQSIKENGTVNLDYQKFAENNDTVELTSEYLDFSINLDNAYDDFMYQSSIYNNEHIEFVDNHGQLPYDLNTAENRNIVTEYINIQLESGSNLSESQKETLTELKNQIDEIKEMESKLGIDEGDLKFIAETKSAVNWTDEAKKTLDERNAALDEQKRDDPF